MSMRDLALDNIEIAIGNVDHRDKVLAALIVMRQLDKGEREEVLRDGLLDYYVYHPGTGTFVDGINNIRLVSVHEYEWDDVEAEFVLLDESERKCAVCLSDRPGDGWVEEAPSFRLCSQDCADSYTAVPWTCDGCLTEVPDGDGRYVDDMRVCEQCADRLTRIS